MRRIGPILILIFLAGCDNPNISKCDDAIKLKLKSPASYHRIGSPEAKPGSGDDFFQIAYDASNEYNALIRSTVWCSIKNGKADIIGVPASGVTRPDDDIAVEDPSPADTASNN